MKYFLRSLAALAAGAVLVVWSPAVNAAETGKAYYNGKTVEWIVSTAPGGGHDFWACLASHTMEKKLPGSSFVVKNRPGAGHIYQPHCAPDHSPSPEEYLRFAATAQASVHAAWSSIALQIVEPGNPRITHLT